MNKKHETPILTRVLFIFGLITILLGVPGGMFICLDSLAEGIVIIAGSLFAGIIYIGIGQAVDYLARTAYSTDRLCSVLETSIMERLKAIEASSSGPTAAPVSPAGSQTGYYYSTDGTQQGPVDASDLRILRKDGLIHDDTQVMREGDTQWRRYRDYLSLTR